MFADRFIEFNASERTEKFHGGYAPSDRPRPLPRECDVPCAFLAAVRSALVSRGPVVGNRVRA